MNIYNTYASQLQSRIAKRSRKITDNEMWEAGYRFLGNRKQELKETKKYLKLLRDDQQLDKKLLKQMQEMAYYLHQDEINSIDFWFDDDYDD